MKILNCLAHTLSDSQQQELQMHEVLALKEVDADLFARLEQCPDDVVALEKAVFELIALTLTDTDFFDAVILPIGSPAFMFFFALQTGLYNDPKCFDKYYFAHSVREFEEQIQPDGSTKKTNVFKHIRFFNLRGSSI